MSKYYYTLLLLLFSVTAKCQDHLFWFKPRIMKTYAKSENITLRDSADYLFLRLAIPPEQIDVMYHFRHLDSVPDFEYDTLVDYRVCDTVQISYQCGSCFETLKTQILSDKRYKWCVIDENNYISQKYAVMRSLKTHLAARHLKIERFESGQYCAVMTFSQIVLESSVMKAMTSKEKRLRYKKPK